MNNWFLLAAIPVFGLCVLVHEFGHFITAKWAGIRVEEFGIGFPPRLVGFRKRNNGGWEVIWFGGKSNAEDTYDIQKQSPMFDNYKSNIQDQKIHMAFENSHPLAVRAAV